MNETTRIQIPPCPIDPSPGALRARIQNEREQNGLQAGLQSGKDHTGCLLPADRGMAPPGLHIAVHVAVTNTAPARENKARKPAQSPARHDVTGVFAGSAAKPAGARTG